LQSLAVEDENVNIQLYFANWAKILFQLVHDETVEGFKSNFMNGPRKCFGKVDRDFMPF